MSIPLDQPERLTWSTFSDAALTIPADPTTVSIDIIDPAGVKTTFTLAGGQVVRDSVGVFHLDYTPALAGHYAYHWKAAGAVATGKDGFFDVDPEFGFATSTLDVLTIAEAKAAITNNAGTNNDALLAAWVTGVSRFLDKRCGPIVKRTITSEALNGADGRDGVLFLRYRPIISITTVTEYSGTAATVLTAETTGTTPSNAYIPDLESGMLFRRNGGSDSLWPRGRQNVLVTYVAGRYTDTASVDERFKRAAGIVLANIWRREHSMGAQLPDGFAMGATFALPNAAKALLADDLQIAFAG